MVGFWKSTADRKQNEEEGRTVRKSSARHVCCVCYAPVDKLTGREYIALIVSLNCMVAVTKMASVAERDFPLERKSLTCEETQTRTGICG